MDGSTLVVIVGLVLVAGSLSLIFFKDTNETEEATKKRRKLLEESYNNSNSILEKGLYASAMRLPIDKQVAEMSKNKAFNSLEAKVKASNKFGGSLEVYILVQTIAILLGLCFLAVLLLTTPGLLFSVVLGLFAIGISGLPYNQVTDELNKRNRRVLKDLPEFVDLLTIPTAAGVGTLESLRVTAQFLPDNQISNEVTWLLTTINSKTMSEKEAFREAGEHLGVPEAISFFGSLGQAYTEGIEINETLQRQAASLRNQLYQTRREQIKKLPASLVVIFGIHFLPLLLAIGVVPLVIAFETL